MSENIPLRIIAHIHSDFPTKFGIPRQSGLIHELKAAVVFEPEYRNPNALRGLEGYTHIWLIWQFSETARQGWSPTVRPPRLGGNTRMGVFASRSPFRPNPIGLSSVRLERIELQSPFGPILHVAGADLMDNTPIYDIKPYLPYVDSHPDAAGGFALQSHGGCLQGKSALKIRQRSIRWIFNLDLIHLAEGSESGYHLDRSVVGIAAVMDFFRLNVD